MSQERRAAAGQREAGTTSWWDADEGPYEMGGTAWLLAASQEALEGVGARQRRRQRDGDVSGECAAARRPALLVEGRVVL